MDGGNDRVDMVSLTASKIVVRKNVNIRAITELSNDAAETTDVQSGNVVKSSVHVEQSKRCLEALERSQILKNWEKSNF